MVREVYPHVPFHVVLEPLDDGGNAEGALKLGIPVGEHVAVLCAAGGGSFLYLRVQSPLQRGPAIHPCGSVLPRSYQNSGCDVSACAGGGSAMFWFCR